MPLPLAGALIKASDFAALFPVGADAWTTYTPTWTQSVAITKTVGQARYTKVGRKVSAHVQMTATGAGVANNAVVGGLPPYAAASAAGFGVVGAGYFYDASVNTVYAVSVLLGATGVQFRTGTSTGDLGATGGVFTAAIAAGDILTYFVEYEATT